LLAGDAMDKAAAADVAAELVVAVDAHQVAPGDGHALAIDQAPEDDAVAVEELAGDELDLIVGRGARSSGFLRRILTEA